jgi:ATP-dependent exoDNAse (exonuclease V) beta subunit
LENFKVIKASAGSGKTFTLTTEYISLLLSNKYEKYFQHILAITFTIKAAAEMKHRILNTLKFLAYEKDLEKILKNDQAEAICKKLKAEYDIELPQIQKRANKIFTNIIHNYSDLSISTIDKFTHKIVRTFAKDLNLSVNFNIEMDESETINKAINLLINKIGEDEFITDILTEFVIENFNQEQSWKIENAIFQISSLIKSNNYESLNEKIGNINKENYRANRLKLKKIKTEILKSYIDKANEIIALIKSYNLNPEDFAGGKNGMMVSIEKITKYDDENLKEIKLTDKRISGIENRDLLYAKSNKDASITSLIDNISSQLFQLLDELIEIYDTQFEKFKVADSALKEFNLIILSEYLQNSIKEVKKDNNVVFMSEFNQLIHNVIKGEHAPYIYERLGEKYNHYMIDEFQDTSVLQWSNLIPLVDNSLASGHESLIVGDSKQAIYRWRGGEVEQFYKLPELPFLTNTSIGLIQENTLKNNYKSIVLKENYRSENEVLDFNNQLFSYFKTVLPKEFEKIYEENEQNPIKNNGLGYVEINLIKKSRNTAKSDDSEESIESAENEERQEFVLLINQINQCINSDCYKLGDMAIIGRNGKELMEIANFLNEVGIPCISEEGLLLSSSHRVDFLINLLYYINNPKENAYILKIFEYFVLEGKLSKDEFAALGSLNSRRADSYFKLYQYLLQFLKKIGITNFNIGDLKTKNLYELVENLIYIFEINKNYDTYIHGFVERVFEYTNKLNIDHSDFLKWWGEKKNNFSIKIPDNIDAIRLLTIHKSKGLQFPIVFCPFFNWEIVKTAFGDKVWLKLKKGELPDINKCIINSNNYKDFNPESQYYTDLFNDYKKNILDNVNLMYVALTRAEEHLYITTNALSDNKKNEIFGGAASINFENLGNEISNYINAFIENNSDKFIQTENQFCFLNSFEEAINNKKIKLEKDKNKKKIEKEENKKILLSEVISKPWENRISISRSTYKEENFLELLDKQIKGNMIHDILSEIKTIDEQEIIKSIDRKIIRGLLSEDDKMEILESVFKIINHDESKRFFEFSDKTIVKNETEILDENGKSYRPDKMIFEDNKATVIDFKTGSVSTTHKEQVKKYLHLLQLQGYTSLKGYLLYTDPIKVIDVV